MKSWKFFEIKKKRCKTYVFIVTSSTENNINLTRQLSDGLKRYVY